MSEEKKPQAEPAPKSKKLLFIIIGVLVLFVAGGGAFFAMQAGVEKQAEPKEIEPFLKLAKLEPFIVNLSQQNAFVKVTMLLEYDQNILDAAAGGEGKGGGHGYGGGAGGGSAAPPPDAMPAELIGREPMIRDAILRVLSSKRPIEVLSIPGKEELKEELIEAVNEAAAMAEGPITNIYFVEFIVQ